MDDGWWILGFVAIHEYTTGLKINHRVQYNAIM